MLTLQAHCLFPDCKYLLPIDVSNKNCCPADEFNMFPLGQDKCDPRGHVHFQHDVPPTIDAAVLMMMRLKRCGLRHKKCRIKISCIVKYMSQRSGIHEGIVGCSTILGEKGHTRLGEHLQNLSALQAHVYHHCCCGKLLRDRHLDPTCFLGVRDDGADSSVVDDKSAAASASEGPSAARPQPAQAAFDPALPPQQAHRTESVQANTSAGADRAYADALTDGADDDDDIPPPALIPIDELQDYAAFQNTVASCTLAPPHQPEPRTESTFVATHHARPLHPYGHTVQAHYVVVPPLPGQLGLQLSHNPFPQSYSHTGTNPNTPAPVRPISPAFILLAPVPRSAAASSTSLQHLVVPSPEQTPFRPWPPSSTS